MHQEDTWKILLPQTSCVFLPGLLVFWVSQKGMLTKYLLHLLPDTVWVKALYVFKWITR